MVKTDKEGIIGYFENIIKICDRTTTGNVSHQMSSIKIMYTYIADEMKKQVGEIMAYHNLKNIVEVASKTNSGNVAHHVATIKGKCRDNIDFINEHGLE